MFRIFPKASTHEVTFSLRKILELKTVHMTAMLLTGNRVKDQEEAKTTVTSSWLQFAYSDSPYFLSFTVLHQEGTPVAERRWILPQALIR